MTATVPYHHPDDEQYSLAYVTTERDDITTEADDAIIERYQLDEPVFVLYTNTGASGTVGDIDDEFEAALDAMDEDDRIFTLRFLQTFEGVIEEKQLEEDELLEIYKQIELEEVPDAIGRVDWDANVVDVAGQLCSTLVLKHPLPNANHRTSIAMAEWYIESADPSFSFPELATADYDWQSWVDPYIVESKRLLTVRRNVRSFRLLQGWGCETILRKGGIEITLAEYDLDMDQSTAYADYGDRHTDICTDFMIESVERTGHEHLRSERGCDYAGFVDYLDTVA